MSPTPFTEEQLRWLDSAGLDPIRVAARLTRAGTQYLLAGAAARIHSPPTADLLDLIAQHLEDLGLDFAGDNADAPLRLFLGPTRCNIKVRDTHGQYSIVLYLAVYHLYDTLGDISKAGRRVIREQLHRKYRDRTKYAMSKLTKLLADLDLPFD